MLHHLTPTGEEEKPANSEKWDLRCSVRRDRLPDKTRLRRPDAGIQTASQETLIETYRALGRARAYASEHGYSNSYGEIYDGGARCAIGTIDWVCGGRHHAMLRDVRQKPENQLALEVVDFIAFQQGENLHALYRPGGIAEAWMHNLDWIKSESANFTKPSECYIELLDKAADQIYLGLTGPSREVVVSPLEQPQQQPQRTEEPAEQPEPVKETEPDRELIPA